MSSVETGLCLDGEPGREPGAARAHEKTRALIAALDWCGYCRQTRELLTQQGVLYTEYDIEKSPRRPPPIRSLNGRGVPVLKVRDEVLYGFNRERILRMVGP